MDTECSGIFWLESAILLGVLKGWLIGLVLCLEFGNHLCSKLSRQLDWALSFLCCIPRLTPRGPWRSSAPNWCIPLQIFRVPGICLCPPRHWYSGQRGNRYLMSRTPYFILATSPFSILPHPLYRVSVSTKCHLPDPGTHSCTLSIPSRCRCPHPSILTIAWDPWTG